MPELKAARRAHGTASRLRRSALFDAMRRATDITPDAWVVFGIVRDEAGEVIDLRFEYGNDAYWGITGLSAAALGRTFSEVAPGVDWTVGLAARLMDAARIGLSAVDRSVRTTPQLGPLAGLERCFELEFTATFDALAAGFRDVTADLEAATAQEAAARRTEALARFLSTAVDPRVDRPRLFQALADALASTIGNLSLVSVPGPGDEVRLIAVAGGPPGMSDPLSGERFAFLDDIPELGSGDPMRAGPIFERGSALLPTITTEVRSYLAETGETLGFPPEVARDVSSMISVPIRSGDQPLGRIVVQRFNDDAPYTLDDVATVETIAAAAALVLERRAAENRLTSSLARFEALFEQAPMPMVAIGSGSGQFNAAALRLFGRSHEEMAAHAFSPDAPWIPKDQAAAWQALRQRVVDGAWEGVSRLFLERPGGERRDVEFSGIPMFVDGRAEGAIAVMNDLTDRESLEAQLRHAQKMEALGRLAGGIAHDFNNVLMAILGFSEFIVEDARQGRVSLDDAEQVVAATRRAIELTARLTTFARRDAAVLERAEVGEVVAGMLPLIRRLIPESIEVVTELRPGPSVILDRVEFEQILVNLVVNAVAAMPSGGRLTIETRGDVAAPGGPVRGLGQDRPQDRAVMVAISDTGMGMDELTRSRVFEPFFTTKEVGVGTGLGLSMVYAAVERIGGRIWLDSEADRGTTFRLYLPPADPDDTTVPAAPARRADVRGGTESILLLEDDDLVRDIVGRTLRGLGYAVTEAARPSDALALAEGNRFDLLVSDVVMPEQSGDAVANELRTKQPDLPVVFMSGYTARALDFRLGPRDALIQKPVAPSDLGAAVRAALDG